MLPIPIPGFPIPIPILIPGVLTGKFQSNLGWKLKPWVQLPQCSLLVSHPFQDKKQKPLLSILFSKLFQGGFWS